MARNWLFLVCWLALTPLAAAQGTAAAATSGASNESNGVAVAGVVVDGETLFRLRGISAAPASLRAELAKQRIVDAARDETIDPTDIELVPAQGYIQLSLNGQQLARLYEVDAEMEGVPLHVQAEAVKNRIAAAIVEWRQDRSPETLLRNTGMLLGITVLAAVLVWIVIAVFSWLNRLIDREVKERLEKLEKASQSLIDSAQVWHALGAVVRVLRTLANIAIVLTWLNAALGLYPWTRPFATAIFRLVLDPLRHMGQSIVGSLPDLAFLVILWFIVRFVLRLTATFFQRVEEGVIRLQSFEPEWAIPTFRIVRVLIIAFGVIVAYPYIPGSDSEAFKGVSIFFGLVLSIGSSSFISNMIAGYSLTYRAAYKVGDRVQIGDLRGMVVEMRAMSTRLRSPKNEEINIPNSVVLSSPVINFSRLAREAGLILHTEVGIGYETPWRQVEAMLLDAAARTPGLEQDPAPFVLQTALGDFAVTYQINAYCRDASQMLRLYSALHANILDVFNEYGVQIMTPAYEGDPDQPKVVPREQWYAAPAAAQGANSPVTGSE